MATPPITTQAAGWVARLDRDDLAGNNMPGDPLVLFEHWFAAARAADMIEPTGATLATADSQARPAARTVLVKSFDPDGFYFYTNYDSHKARELLDNPQAALLFWWDALERQVRIEGRVRKLTDAQSEQYFASRPRGSQIGAHASPQSQTIADRNELETRFAATQQRFDGQPVPRPSGWGGYCLEPEMIEFWQGRANRLHDRLRYRKVDGQWQLQRLAP